VEFKLYNGLSMTNFFKPTVQPKTLLLKVFLVLFFYKLYKFIIAQALGYHNYYLLEYFHSIYRLIAILLAFYWINQLYPSPKKQFIISNRPLVLLNLGIFFPLFFIIRYLNYDFSFHFNQFFQELGFCVLVGLFEEFFFRGLMLTLFFNYFTKSKAIIFSSLIFMIWHLDVTQNHLELFTIFLASIYFSLNFTSGISLLVLAFFHFLWDLIISGFGWEVFKHPTTNFYDEYLRIALLITFSWFIYVYNKRKKN